MTFISVCLNINYEYNVHLWCFLDRKFSFRYRRRNPMSIRRIATGLPPDGWNYFAKTKKSILPAAVRGGWTVGFAIPYFNVIHRLKNKIKYRLKLICGPWKLDSLHMVVMALNKPRSKNDSYPLFLDAYNLCKSYNSLTHLLSSENTE